MSELKACPHCSLDRCIYPPDEYTIDLKPLEELYERWKASPFGHELGKIIRQMKEDEGERKKS